MQPLWVKRFAIWKTHMSLAKALNLWIEITGVDPSKQDFRMGEFEIRGMHKALKEALELDDTEITGRLLFEYLATSYLRDRTFSVEDLLEKPEQVAKYLEKSRELLAYLRSDEITQIGQMFMDRVKQAVSAYGVSSSETKELSLNRHQLAVLRRDALRTMKNLSVHQFLSGTPENDDYKPVYGKHVYRWWNINSMLKMLTTIPSGVTVNLIVDPVDGMRSYFCFAIRNGGNIFIFTDKESLPHPNAEDLMRRMDKVLAERIARNWFPYSLLGVKYNEKGCAYIEAPDTTALVPYQKEVQPIHPINDLDAPEVIWLTMMLSMIVDKFWNQGYQAPALCYTGEMIKIESPLAEAAKSANLPVIGYKPLKLKPLTLADVRTETGKTKAFGKTGKHDENRWLEKRYADKVTNSCLNIVAQPSVQMISKLGTDNPEALLPFEEARDIGWGRDGQIAEGRVELKIIKSTSFGTKEELDADRLFVARQNYARQINALALKEFDERNKEISRWVKAKIKENLENIWPLVAQEKVIVPCVDLDKDHNHGACCWRSKDKRTLVSRDDLLEVSEGKLWRLENLYSYYSNGNIVFQGDGDRKQNRPPCFKTNAPSSYAVQLIPETTEELANLCGCEIAGLPDVLQHWTQIKRYVGNHISDRIDPLIWEINDPWNRLQFGVTFMLSKRALAAIEKQYGKVSVEV